MDIPSLSPEDLKILDRTRNALFQLSNNIASLRSDVVQGNPLPPWSSIQASTTILGQNINTLVDSMSKNSDLFNRTVVFPSTNFPGRTQEPLLQYLLRKKSEVPVENWVDEGLSIHAEADDGKDLEELWSWAGDWIGTRVAKYILEESGDDYTIDEREAGISNVRTGLRKSDEDESSEEEDEDEEMEDVGVNVTLVRRTSVGQVEFGVGEIKKKPEGQAKRLEDILKFATGGLGVNQAPNGNR